MHWLQCAHQSRDGDRMCKDPSICNHAFPPDGWPTHCPARISSVAGAAGTLNPALARPSLQRLARAWLETSPEASRRCTLPCTHPHKRVTTTCKVKNMHACMYACAMTGTDAVGGRRLHWQHQQYYLSDLHQYRCVQNIHNSKQKTPCRNHTVTLNNDENSKGKSTPSS